ncbi:Flp pilus assembly protein TadG [Rhizobium sp. SG_E_25_P2]|uniref:vWA domain-containing protein n=1 Tax=Rhizobium sp. SG_E_25_P2 TaxID=2879942 RepID=UPI002473D393|nr:TadE/TadG family type IV pilus assembly protein [Rhizobium sp. SG_E_25_P2]MDH6268857.1 Flp pilus assembly protein TadG [Rhizobium sp. SG_E_25_P2]
MMRPRGRCFTDLRRLLKDKRGNFSIMSALILPVGLGAAGLAIDASQLIANKNALQAAADAAALATASALAKQTITTNEARAFAVDFVKGQMSNQVSSDDAEEEDQQFDFSSCTDVGASETSTVGTAKKYNVTVTTCLDVDYSALSNFLGKDGGRLTVSASTVSTTESKNALSMYLVLDRSGSMAEYTDTVSGSYTCRYGRRTYTCYTYYDKITALRNAANSLMSQLASADPDTVLVRTAAVSYNSAMQTPVNLAWGEDHAKTYINALTATGGTDSSAAFKTAYQALNAASEDAAHAEVNGQTPSKFIVFMTDGDNNYTSADTTTKQWCDSARTAGIEVYSVAFMAPDRGKALLNYCATTSAHYFAAEDADDLNAAFEYIGERATETATRLTQ